MSTQPSARVLVVDDESEIRRLLQMQLKRRGYTVDTADGALNARRMLSEQPYDLVICDFRMPDGTAIDVYQALGDKTRFILVSGYSEMDEEKLKAMGIREILAKPVNFETLIQRVNASLLN